MLIFWRGEWDQTNLFTVSKNNDRSWTSHKRCLLTCDNLGFDPIRKHLVDLNPLSQKKQLKIDDFTNGHLEHPSSHLNYVREEYRCFNMASHPNVLHSIYTITICKHADDLKSAKTVTWIFENRGLIKFWTSTYRHIITGCQKVVMHNANVWAYFSARDIPIQRIIRFDIRVAFFSHFKNQLNEMPFIFE